MNTPKPGDRITLKEAIQYAKDLMYDLPNPQPRESVGDAHASWRWNDYGGSITLAVEVRFVDRRIEPVVFVDASIGSRSIHAARDFATLLTTATARGTQIQNLLNLFVIVP